MRQVLADFPGDHFGSCVCDPPYELGFMGKAWDSSGIAFSREAWSSVLRVLKPGAHLVAFGGTRTWHRIAVAIEDAGFEIRDNLAWLYGQGFPKSLDVSKAIDKAAGADRPVVGTRVLTGSAAMGTAEKGGTYASNTDSRGRTKTVDVTGDAKQWAGWGTALKPSFEPIILARKPLIGTVAANVLAHGTGALNVDGCREARAPGDVSGWSQTGSKASENIAMSGANYARAAKPDNPGRWPPNVCVDDAVAADLTEVARYFYCPKAGAKERDAGLDHWPTLKGGDLCEDRKEGSAGLKNPRAGSGRGGDRRNPHPTVKPLELMRWLVRLITPPGGLVLDPFCGSGTTGVAAVLEGLNFVGIDLSEDYVRLSADRIAHWAALAARQLELSEFR